MSYRPADTSLTAHPGQLEDEMAHTKQRMAREVKRAGQIERTGLVRVVSDDEPANEGSGWAWFGEEDLAAADLELATDKAAKAHVRNDAAAASLQMQHLDAMRRAGL